MVNFETMIKRFYPDAVPGRDYQTVTADDGRISISEWNTKKLGAMPDIPKLHKKYMELAREIKEYSPKFDDSDPAPWLSEKKKDEPEKIRHSSNHSTVYNIHNTRLPLVNFDPETGVVTYKGDSGNE